LLVVFSIGVVFVGIDFLDPNGFPKVLKGDGLLVVFSIGIGVVGIDCLNIPKF